MIIKLEKKSKFEQCVVRKTITKIHFNEKLFLILYVLQIFGILQQQVHTYVINIEIK
jgi:hypothetical protein